MLDRREKAPAKVKAMHDESAARAAWEDGDFAAAASAVIRQFGPEVLGYLVGTLGDVDLADDAFSACCERVWQAMARFEWKCSVRTWLYALARRSSADALRRGYRERRRQQPLSDSQVSALAAEVRTATVPLLHTQGKSALAALRDELAPLDKELLVLRVDRGLAWEELARVFLATDSPEKDELSRETARLRKRFQLVKASLRERARRKGLLQIDKE